MKQIYIVLMHTHTCVSEFVRLVTRYRYSHVAIAFDEGCTVLYSFGRRRARSFLDGGMSIERYDGEFFRLFPRTECIIYRVPVTDQQYALAASLVRGMVARREQYRYDFTGALLRYLGFPVTFHNRFVCSYFVAHILQSAGILQFRKRVCLVTPRVFYALDGFEEIYRGRYLAWPQRYCTASVPQRR